MRVRLTVLALLALWTGGLVPAQAPPGARPVDGRLADRLAENKPNLVQLIVAYRTLRNVIDETPELAQRLDQIERQATQEHAAGRTGQARRHLYEALHLLSGAEWNEAVAFAHSLVARTDQVVTDPSRPLLVHLGQLYPAAAPGGAPLRVESALRRPEPGWRGMPRPGDLIRRLAVADAVPRDLVESPLTLRLDLSEAPAGAHLLTLAVTAGGAPVRDVSLPIQLVPGIAEAETEVRRRLDALQGFDSAKATALYPFDFATQVNLGWRGARGYDFVAQIDQAKALLGELESGRDPLAVARGVLSRHYRFADAAAIMPYGMLVPARYDPGRRWPLIIALHGLGGDESTLLERDGRLIAQLAEDRGYLVAAPLGFRPDGGYGRPTSAVDPVADWFGELSERDVLNVVAQVQSHYAVDPDRVYLMGHSMGGNGTWRIGARHAEIFAALAPVAGGSVSPEQVDVERLAELPILCAHGAADATAPVEASRRLVARVRAAGGDCTLFEVAEADHSSIVPLAVPRIFDFFDQKRRGD